MTPSPSLAYPLKYIVHKLLHFHKRSRTCNDRVISNSPVSWPGTGPFLAVQRENHAHAPSTELFSSSCYKKPVNQIINELTKFLFFFFFFCSASFFEKKCFKFVYWKCHRQLRYCKFTIYEHRLQRQGPDIITKWQGHLILMREWTEIRNSGRAATESVKEYPECFLGIYKTKPRVMFFLAEIYLNLNIKEMVHPS